MTNQEALQAFVAVGDGAKEVLDSWLLLQWVKYWTGSSLFLLLLAGLAFVVRHEFFKKIK